MSATYALWIMPRSPLYEILGNVIRNLSGRCDPIGPIFEPHVVIACPLKGKEEIVIELAKAFAQRLKPFKVHLDPPPKSGCPTCACLPATFLPDEVTTLVADFPEIKLSRPRLPLFFGQDGATLIKDLPSGQLPKFPCTFGVAHLCLVQATSTPGQKRMIGQYPLRG